MGRIEPVSDHENQKVNGEALCTESVLQEHTQKVEKLREQQKGYIDSLPSEPGAAFVEALKTMHPGVESYPDGFEEALHLSQLLEEVLRHSDMENGGAVQDAAAYAAMRCSIGLYHAQKSLDHVSKVLSKAKRASQERG